MYFYLLNFLYLILFGLGLDFLISPLLPVAYGFQQFLLCAVIWVD
jgi:hypothetical protein